MVKQHTASSVQQSQAWQQAILDSADFTIISTDPQGIIQTLNDGALRKLGYQPEEVIGKVTPAIIHDPQEVAQRAQQLSQELGYLVEPGFETFVAKARLGIPDENNWTYIRKDQSRFPICLSVTALRDGAGNLSGFLGIGKDISKQQKIEQSLHESEARFAGAFQHAAIGMAIVSLEGYWLQVNASLCEIIGYSEDELLTLTFQDITHPDDLEIDLAYVQQLLAGEIDHCHIEKRYIHKQGHEVWILLSASLVCGDDGQPLYFIAQIQDISQRKQTEADLHQFNTNLERLVRKRTDQLETAYNKLKTSEAQYQDLYDNAPDMYVSVDALTSKIQQCNQTLCNVLGFSKDEILDRSIFELYHPDCHPQVEKTFQTFIDTGEVKDVQLVVQRKSGSKIEVSLNARAVCDDDGNILYSLLSWRDITQRKQLERQLQQVNTELEQRVQDRTQQLETTNQSLQYIQERLELVLEASEAGWWHWHVQSGELEWSPSYVRMFGFEEGELQANYETWESLVHPDDMPWIKEKLNAHLQDSSVSYAFDYRMRAKSGEWKWIANLGKVVERDEQGQPVRMAGMHLDITDRKLAETKLQQTNAELQAAKEAADTASRAKSEFLANMSHELRTPMNAVIGMTGLLAHTPLTPQQQDFVDTIRSSGDALLNLINDILDFSKIEAGKLEFEEQPFNLRHCIEDALKLVAPKAFDKGLELAYLATPDLPCGIIGDVTRLRQVLVNLLNNAVKFTETGEVIVQVKDVTDDPILNPESAVPAQINHHLLQFSVQDTGIGIPSDRMHRLFQSFSQVDTSTTRKYGGTGLGLAISKRLCELMGGQIWVESDLGVGATFSFTISVQAATNIECFPDLDLQDLAGKRLLIVDDHLTNRKILTLLAGTWKMESQAVSGGPEALDLLQRESSFDVAVIDMQMPDMDGLTLAKQIRALALKPDIPLIMLSSLGMEAIPTARDKSYFSALLNKPIQEAQLGAALVRAVADQPHKIAPMAKPSPSLPDPSLKSLRILLAEDVVVNQKVALLILKQLGYDADVANNGLEVLAALRRQSYDVVLMDVQMPEMDGLTAARQIQESESLEARPYIIALTANAMQGDREKCLEVGMQDYVSKPIRSEELKAALERFQAVE